MSGYGPEFEKYYNLLEQALPEYLPKGDGPWKTVEEAMAYGLLGGGKRIRGVMVLSFCALCCGSCERAIPFACAIEMIHAYSLIHDDLPCMDNDAFRRGKPSCHIAYGEAPAVLAGDALLTHAFQTALKTPPDVPAQVLLQAIETLAQASGTRGMIGGQIMDIETEEIPLTAEQLDLLNGMKTGALIRAAAKIGCILGGASEDLIKKADVYAAKLGLGFQITDDVLDVVSTTQVLGKPIASDSKRGKATYATLLGVENALALAVRLSEEAIALLRATPLDCEFLTRLARSLAHRDR